MFLILQGILGNTFGEDLDFAALSWNGSQGQIFLDAQ